MGIYTPNFRTTVINILEYHGVWVAVNRYQTNKISGKIFISQHIFVDFRQSTVAKNSMMEKIDMTLGHEKLSVVNRQHLHNDKLEIANYGKCYERNAQELNAHITRG